GPEVARQLRFDTGSGSVKDRYYHPDSQGTAQALTTGTGQLETSYAVDAWGNVLSGSPAANPYDYVAQGGHRHETAPRLLYAERRAHARHWRPDFLLRLLYTGDALASDAIYNEGLEGAAEALPTQLHAVEAEIDAIESRVESVVRHAAKGGSGALAKACLIDR